MHLYKTLYISVTKVSVQEKRYTADFVRFCCYNGKTDVFTKLYRVNFWFSPFVCLSDSATEPHSIRSLSLSPLVPFTIQLKRDCKYLKFLFRASRRLVHISNRMRILSKAATQNSVRYLLNVSFLRLTCYGIPNKLNIEDKIVEDLVVRSYKGTSNAVQ